MQAPSACKPNRTTIATTTTIATARQRISNSLENLDSPRSIPEMPSDHPQTPQSPSPFESTDLPSKLSASPKINNSLPTPAHSINGSMSSTTADLSVDGMHLEDSSNKRKRDLEDHGDQEQKKVHVEDSRVRIEDLHLDVGKKYSLCRTRKAPFFLVDLPYSHLPWHYIPI